MKRYLYICLLFLSLLLLFGCQADEITTDSFQNSDDNSLVAPPIDYVIESQEDYEFLRQAVNQLDEKEFRAFIEQRKDYWYCFKSKDELGQYLDQLHAMSSSVLYLNTPYEKVVLYYYKETEPKLRWRLRYAITPLSGQEDVPDHLKKYQILDIQYFVRDEDDVQKMDIPYPIVKTVSIEDMSVPIRITPDGELVAYFYKNGYLVAVWGIHMSSEDLDAFASALASATFMDAATKE